VRQIETQKKRLNDVEDVIPVIVAINKSDLVEGAPLTVEGIREKDQTRVPWLFFASASTGLWKEIPDFVNRDLGRSAVELHKFRVNVKMEHKRFRKWTID
jgi:50S ribosomal subunit-associated GTPase HflX